MSHLNRSQSIVKPWTKQDCIHSAQHQLTSNNMAYSVNPKPANAHCLQKANAVYQKQVNQCNRHPE